MAKATFTVEQPAGSESDDNLSAIMQVISALQLQYDTAAESIAQLSKRVTGMTPMVGIVKGRAIITSPISYGPFALEVYVPELGDDQTDTRVAQCERESSGRIIIPKKGSYVTVYKKHGSEDRLIWRGMGVEGFPSLTKEQRSSKFRQLTADSLITDIDIYESNDDFSFLLDRTIPGLHKLVLELTSPLGKVFITTGPGGKILIGDGELADIELDVEKAIKISAGSTPIGTLDLNSGGDMSLTASPLGDILLDAFNVEVSTMPGGNIKLTPGPGGKVKLGIAAAIPVNNLPTCLFTGAPHSTSLDVLA